MKFEVKQLSECLECLTTVGTWIYEEWWNRRYNTPEVVLSWLRTHTRKDRVPYSVVAFADGTPIGSCCVIENDCIHRQQYDTVGCRCLREAGMRHRGVASRVLQEAAAIATRIGVDGLYIDCLAITAPVYEKNSWRIYEREVGDKDSVVMLRKTNGGPRAKEAGVPNK